MNDWKQDLQRSSAVVKKALPILRNMLGQENLEIMRVEGKEEEVCMMLDATCGIDYFLIHNDSYSFGVAWRAQWVDSNNVYNSFTVRKTRDSGKPTEYEKRKEAIRKKSTYPKYVVQAYLDENTNEILSMAITTTEDILRYIENEKVYVRHTGKDQKGQAAFYVLYWQDMKAYGYNIIIYKRDIGIL